MWWGCHGIPPYRVSASTGPASSTSTSTTTNRKVTSTEVWASSSTIQPTCAASTHPTLVRHAARRSGSAREARSHWKVIATRITT